MQAIELSHLEPRGQIQLPKGGKDLQGWDWRHQWERIGSDVPRGRFTFRPIPVSTLYRTYHTYEKQLLDDRHATEYLARAWRLVFHSSCWMIFSWQLLSAKYKHHNRGHSADTIQASSIAICIAHAGDYRLCHLRHQAICLPFNPTHFLHQVPGS